MTIRDKVFDDTLDLDDRLDALYDVIDALLWTNQFDQVDDLLATLVEKVTDVDILIGALSITLNAKHKLKRREVVIAALELASSGWPDDDIVVALRGLR